ncbi:MAG TPA: hypothetical protein V6C99_09175 [Oculatellaceae cyanobacterium]|jgi:hypothetical protein
MIYTPSAKALVYRELRFITTVAPVPKKTPSIQQIFDEVAEEIRASFLGTPKASKTAELCLENI